MKDAILPDSFAVGLSGGADSVVLLYRSLALPGKRLVALHFNHGFSDENGDEAEAYCRALCARLKVPLVVGTCTTSWDQKTTKEVFARQQRFAFFKRAMEAEGLRHLALAHHAGDRAENLVLRLARGSSLEGLVSFGPKTPFPGWPEATIYRPLLDECHEAFVAWLEARGERWIEDTSNVDTSIPRNAIRHYVRGVLPHFVAGANLCADILEEENAYLHTLVTQAVVRCDEKVLELADATALVLCRRALRRWLSEVRSYGQLQALAQLPVGASYNLTRHVRVVRSGPMQWQREVQQQVVSPEPLWIEAPGIYTFGPWKIAIGALPEGGAARFSVVLPLPLVVRSRQPGDKLVPRGFKGSKKVQDLLTELKIPVVERSSYPLFFDTTGRLLYLPGVRPAAIEARGVSVALWCED